jgi:hypothetical protein
MADQLATPTDLASYLQKDVDTSTATLLVECATAVVQEACGGQRIVEVDADTLTVMGSTDSWLPLPQIPVISVASVSVDGLVLTVGADYKLVGAKLWRIQGWQMDRAWPWYGPQTPWSTWYQQPSLVSIVYSHGIPPGDQRLQFARASVLGLAGGVYNGTPGRTSESIDDYSVTFEAMAARMEAAPHLKAALAKKYGRRAGLARIG